jgi:hypothetical protein
MSINSRAQRIFKMAVTANNVVDETKNEGKFGYHNLFKAINMHFNIAIIY